MGHLFSNNSSMNSQLRLRLSGKRMAFDYLSSDELIGKQRADEPVQRASKRSVLAKDFTLDLQKLNSSRQECFIWYNSRSRGVGIKLEFAHSR
jgi:hypothetical protein